MGFGRLPLGEAVREILHLGCARALLVEELDAGACPAFPGDPAAEAADLVEFNSENIAGGDREREPAEPEPAVRGVDHDGIA